MQHLGAICVMTIQFFSIKQLKLLRENRLSYFLNSLSQAIGENALRIASLKSRYTYKFSWQFERAMLSTIVHPKFMK